MKLLILFKNIDGGTGTYLEGLTGLKNKEWDMEVLVLEKPVHRIFKKAKLRYFYTKRLPERYGVAPRTAANFLKELFWFNRSVKRFKPDIVVANDLHSILISESVKRIFFRKYKSISVVHNYLPAVFKLRIPPFFIPSIYKLAFLALSSSDKVVAVSRDLATNLKTLFKLKTEPAVIPGAVLSKEKALNIKKRFGKKFIVISIARLAPQKDHRTLIKAFDRLCRIYPSCELWLVGDGPLKPSLVKMAERLGLDQNVKFLGWINDSGDLLKKSSVFVLSSHWEGFPLSILEAMASGVPVIATDCPYGPKEIIGKNQYGILVKPENSNDLFRALKYLHDNLPKIKYYSKAGLLKAADYSGRAMIGRFRELVADID